MEKTTPPKKRLVKLSKITSVPVVKQEKRESSEEVAQAPRLPDFMKKRKMAACVSEDEEEQLPEEKPTVNQVFRKNCWRTPPSVIKWLKDAPQFNNCYFIGDACASDQNRLFPFYYTEEVDAMNQDWRMMENAIGCDGQHTVTTCCYRREAMKNQTEPEPITYWFINPPYGKTAKGYELTDWFRKCHNQALKGIGIVMLVPSANGEMNRWGKYVFGKASVIYNIESRVKFGDPDTCANPSKKDRAATFGSWLVVYDPRLICEVCTKDDGVGHQFFTVIKPLYL